MAIDAGLDPELLVPWTRKEALAWGETDRSILAKVRSNDWVRIRHGAFLSGALWADLSPEDRHRARARAVLKVTHPTTVLSHVSAALEMDAPVWDLDLSRVHVTRTDGHPGRKTTGVVHHRGALSESEVAVRHGVRLTTGARAAFEVTTMTDVEHALVVVDGLLHAGEADLAELDALVQSRRRWPHSLTSDLVVRLADGRHGSAGESRCHHLFWTAGIPMPVPQHPILDESGHTVAYADFAWPSAGVFIEFDGRAKYERLLRPGQSATDAMLAQQRREELICRLTGWVCLRLNWQDLATPRATARRIKAMLESRRTGF